MMDCKSKLDLADYMRQRKQSDFPPTLLWYLQPSIETLSACSLLTHQPWPLADLCVGFFQALFKPDHVVKPGLL